MFSENRNQPILTEFRGCFPHAEVFNSIVKRLDELKTPYIEMQRVD